MDQEIDRLVVRGFWGPREETAGQCAQRWLAFLDRLAAVVPGAPSAPGGWRDAEGGPLPAGVDAVASAIEAKADPADAARGLGYVFSVACSLEDGYRLSARGSTGMSAHSSTLSNRMILEIKAPRGSGTGLDAAWPPVAVAALVGLAEEWDPDRGDVTCNALRDHLGQAGERARRTPDTGFATYLSSGRAALLPPDLPGSRSATRTGGVLLTLLAPDGALPSPDAVLQLDTTLRSSPAYAPAPTDAPHLGAPATAAGNGANGANGAGRRDGGGLRLRNLRYPPTAANAGRFAEDIVAAAARIDGRHLDYSVASLQDVDAILGGMHDDGVALADVGEAVFGFGCYLGEVLVRHAGARWVELDEADADALGQRLAVRAPDDVLWNPIGKAFRRVGDGPEESVKAFADFVISR